MHLGKTLVLLLALLFIFSTNTAALADMEPKLDEKELTKRAQEIYNFRAQALITGVSCKNIPSLYDVSSKYAQWALDHEQNRINFIQSWAKKRGVKFTDVESRVVLKNLRIGENSAKFTAYQTVNLAYQYPGDKSVNRFSVGMTHWVELVNKDDKWLVRKEYYTDALGDDTLVYRPQPDDGAADVGVKSPARPADPVVSGQMGYDRQGAVAYAEKYWGSGNSKYNKKYQNLNGIGGDCTNFVSQCLAEGGKVPVDGTWYNRGGSGSLAWVRTISFAHWLSYSGKAAKLTKGTFQELNQPNDKYIAGAIRELRPGDLIGYEEKGRIQHFAIITGFDAKGYPVVNAHTTDRFHCPWDMGWDKKTVFHLYKMKD